MKIIRKERVKIIVMSDNHGDIKTMDSIIEHEKPDYTIHCGDYLIKKKLMEERFDYFVLGNNDIDKGEFELNVEIKGYKFRILHGHTLGIDVYYPNKLIHKIAKAKYDVLIHGHVHVPILLQENNKTLFCPGSTTYPRNAAGATYGVIEIINNDIKFHHVKI